MIRILLVDDHELMRQGIRALLERNPSFEICAEATSGTEAVEKALEYGPDVVVLDVTMPGMGGLEAARLISEKLPESHILMFTIHDNEEMVRNTLDAGAHGYILKSDASTRLETAVEAVANGNLYFSSGVAKYVIESVAGAGVSEDIHTSEVPLSPREIEIVRLLGLGKSSKEIANDLFISVRTVETHRRTINRKLEITSVAGLVRYAIRHRLIGP
jgi:DNA-binding NarL/FixJ family response regulator